MALKAGFAEVDITPPLGTQKMGWKKVIIADHVIDPLYAHAAVLSNGDATVAFVQLDTISVRWTVTQEIRRRCSESYGLDGAGIMVCGTHNHAGPAVSGSGDATRDDSYVESMIGNAVEAVGRAQENMCDAQIGMGSCYEFDVGYNRRVVLRDGTVSTHANFDGPNGLYIEGPIDPEVAVIAARTPDGSLLGAIVNFACHPTHHGGSTGLSAGYPGALAGEMKRRGCPVTLFFNGASGNISWQNPIDGGRGKTMEEIGAVLADDVESVLGDMDFTSEVEIGSLSTRVDLPNRQPTEAEIAGTNPGAQRFVDPEIYERRMPQLLERLARRPVQPAEVMAVWLNDHVLLGIPAEYFVQHGLRIKEETFPRHTLIVGHANGMVGYVPHREAFKRGGYETTLCNATRLAPEAGDLLADCAIRLVNEGP
jgi:hypothetical protein